MHQNYLFCIHYVSTSIYLVILTRKGILPRSLFHTQHLHSMYHKLCYLSFYFQFSSVAQSCLTLCDPMNLSRQASLSVTSSQNSLRLKSIESVMPSSHLILCRPPLLLQSFPTSGSFKMSQLFASGDQNIGVSASASLLPMNIQH